eukprot:2148989-Amphidinium_carterae.1
MSFLTTTQRTLTRVSALVFLVCAKGSLGGPSQDFYGPRSSWCVVGGPHRREVLALCVRDSPLATSRDAQMISCNVTTLRPFIPPWSRFGFPKVSVMESRLMAGGYVRWSPTSTRKAGHIAAPI